MKNKGTLSTKIFFVLTYRLKGGHGKRVREKGKCFQYMDLEIVSKSGMDKSISPGLRKCWLLQRYVGTIT